MIRVRISELMAKRQSMTKAGLARKLFAHEDLADGTKRNRITAWDKGRNLGTLPEHILTLAKELEATTINELFEDDGA